MKTKLFVSLFMLMLLFNNTKSANLQPDIDRAAYYNVLKAGSLDEIEKEFLVIDASSVKEKEAYKGTLMMKKAGLIKKAKYKLSLFKEGRVKLETELHIHSNNTEYHFLRLIIEEHAPKVTKYHTELEEDADYIKKNYKSLLPAVQRAVIDYSKTSNVIHFSDFNPADNG